MIHNVSDHTLTEKELLVLTKDLSFVPTPTKNFEREITKSWSNFKTHMLEQNIFFATASMKYSLLLRKN